MESFLYNKSEAESLTDITHIKLCSIRSLKELFNELSKQTCSAISDWDDLEEYLFCLEGCSSKEVLIEHCDMPQLYKDELCCYLRILQDAAWYWEANEELHRLYYIFPVKDMVFVRTLLEKYYCYAPIWLKQSPIDSISVNKYPHEINIHTQILLMKSFYKPRIISVSLSVVRVMMSQLTSLLSDQMLLKTAKHRSSISNGFLALGFHMYNML